MAQEDIITLRYMTSFDGLLPFVNLQLGLHSSAGHASRERLPFRTPGSVPPFWDLLVLQLLKPDSSNLPCLYSTFHLEYPLVLSRFCSYKTVLSSIENATWIVRIYIDLTFYLRCFCGASTSGYNFDISSNRFFKAVSLRVGKPSETRNRPFLKVKLPIKALTLWI